MNNIKVFKVLYYLCFGITALTYFMVPQLVSSSESFLHSLPANILLRTINLFFVITFSILLLRKKVDKVNILFPIIYLFFFFLIIVLAFIANNKLIIPNIHFGYYFSIVLFNYLLLNIYSLLSITKK